ncbi:hypothetical protein [uncultured Dokdonia sp.]|uniref:hypothetical protein n=1 Tax=uncultured Dokdonia sp. TaxID=575653 RepID=UPI0023A355BE|nr:hypothetical protein [uncultured Dokdonia sp.]MDE0598656.1 hypothetical protein [Dokdonia donghaensis]
MKEHKLHTFYRAAALLVMFAFMLPAIVSFIHSTENHTHYDTCSFGNKTHVHEKNLDCDLGDLHIVKVGVYAFAKAYKTITLPNLKEVDVLPKTFYKNIVLSSSDRGPPFC